MHGLKPLPSTVKPSEPCESVSVAPCLHNTRHATNRVGRVRKLVQLCYQLFDLSVGCKTLSHNRISDGFHCQGRDQLYFARRSRWLNDIHLNIVEGRRSE